MRRTRRNIRKAISVVALSLAALTVFSGTASAAVRDHAASQPGPSASKIQQPGGVTPTNLARAYEPRFEGVRSPDGYQPQLRGDEPLVIRDAPDGFVPQTSPSDVVSVAATSDGWNGGDLVIGLGLGLILASACAAALAAARGRMRMAHS